jgi:hypothetical protein
MFNHQPSQVQEFCVEWHTTLFLYEGVKDAYSDYVNPSIISI